MGEARVKGIRSSRSVLAGLLFASFGAAGLVLGRRYEAGTAFQMGPGYFPMLVGWALVLIGGWLAVMGFAVSGEAMQKVMLRPLVLVLGSVVIFALFVRPLGLFIATIMLICVAGAGGRDFRPREITVLALVLAAGSVLVFVWGLGLPFSVWPR